LRLLELIFEQALSVNVPHFLQIFWKRSIYLIQNWPTLLLLLLLLLLLRAVFSKNMD
jgi:hypothetical protein